MKLVTDSVKKLCDVIKRNSKKHRMKVVLMNTVGSRNRDLDEQVSYMQKFIIGLLRRMLPPHLDNEMAAEYLRTQIGQGDPVIEWAIVRPDTLINEAVVTAYEVFPSPTRSAIFNSGQTSRINVGHFMAELITQEPLWDKWKGKMPVIYNKSARGITN